ncbi:MAG: hypothetical protein U0271_42905 [Polyangiaceae bacterium]
MFGKSETFGAWVRRGLAGGAAALAIVSFFGGCGEKKMDPAECEKIRADAFKLMNEGQTCNTDADCKEAAWPQCRRAISKKTFDALADMEKKVEAGKCDDKGYVCKDSPPVYCKQGLCTNRESGTESPY